MTGIEDLFYPDPDSNDHDRQAPPTDGDSTNGTTDPAERARPTRPARTAPNAWPKPINRFDLPGVLGQLVNAVVESTEADPVTIFFQLLALCGVIVGHGPYFAIGTIHHSMKLNLIVVGQTSTGRKGESWGVARRLIKEAFRFSHKTENEDFLKQGIRTGLASGEGLIVALAARDKDAPDLTTVDRRMLVMEPEFSRTLRASKRQHSILSSILRTSWDTDRLEKMTAQNPLAVDGTHVALIGHITQQELLAELDEHDLKNGFVNRFLFIVSKQAALRPIPSELDLAAIESPLRRLMGNLERAFSLKDGQITRDDQAAEQWITYYMDANQFGRTGVLDSIQARTDPYIVRISALLALIDGRSVITLKDQTDAEALVAYAVRCAEYIFSGSTGNPYADRMLALLRDHPNGIGRSDLSRMVGKGNTLPRRIFDEAVNSLIDGGFVVVEKIKTGGADRTVYKPGPLFRPEDWE